MNLLSADFFFKTYFFNKKKTLPGTLSECQDQVWRSVGPDLGPIHSLQENSCKRFVRVMMEHHNILL